jgi:hypothetical protein
MVIGRECMKDEEWEGKMGRHKGRIVENERQGQVKVSSQLDLLASDGAHWCKIIVIEVILVLVRVTTGARHRLRGQAVVVEERSGRRGDLGVGAAPTRGGHTRVDARHAEAIRTRECRGKAVSVSVLWRGGRLAVGGLLSVSKIG